VDRSRAFAAAKGGWSGTRRFLGGAGGLREAADLGSTDSASPATLRAFLEWGTGAVAGERTLLVLWGHGRGERGLLLDEDAGSVLTVPQLVEALGGVRVDVLALDACSMQTLDVARALVGTAPWLVASESRQDALGWSYRALMEGLARRPSAAPREVALALASHAGTERMPYTVSVVRLDEVLALGRTVDALADGARRLGGAERRAVAVRLSSLRPTTRELGAVDLGAVLAALRPELPELVRPTERAYAAAVTFSSHGIDFDDASGMAIDLARFFGVP
jgi:hypothetical protein